MCYFYFVPMENDVIKTELTQMEIRLSDMEEKMDSIDTKLTQVVDAILGNPLTKTGGFIHDIEVLKSKIELLEKKQEVQEEFRKRISWTIGIVLAAAILVQYLVNIYVNVNK